MRIIRSRKTVIQELERNRSAGGPVSPRFIRSCTRRSHGFVARSSSGTLTGSSRLGVSSNHSTMFSSEIVMQRGVIRKGVACGCGGGGCGGVGAKGNGGQKGNRKTRKGGRKRAKKKHGRGSKIEKAGERGGGRRGGVRGTWCARAHRRRGGLIAACAQSWPLENRRVVLV